MNHVGSDNQTTRMFVEGCHSAQLFKRVMVKCFRAMLAQRLRPWATDYKVANQAPPSRVPSMSLNLQSIKQINKMLKTKIFPSAGMCFNSFFKVHYVGFWRALLAEMEYIFHDVFMESISMLLLIPVTTVWIDMFIVSVELHSRHVAELEQPRTGKPLESTICVSCSFKHQRERW